MIAVLPLIGGVLLSRFANRRATAIGVEILLFALAAAVLIATAPDHGRGYGAGVLLSAVLAPLCALAMLLGTLWRGRTSTNVRVH